MANPGITGADKAQNSISERLKDVLANPAVEEKAAATTAAPTTTPASGTEEKTAQQFKYTDATTSFIGKINAARNHHNAAIDASPLGVAKKEFGNKTRIVGYCCRLPEKIDFKRVVTVNKEAGTDATYSFELNMSAPSKPDRVLVKYPLDMLAKIDNAASNITTKDITEMNALMDSEAAFAVQIFRVAKNDHSFYDWMSQHCYNGYINEAEEIFVPYTKINSKGEATVLDNYIGEAAYASTGEKPGLKMTCRIEAKKEAKVEIASKVTQIDITRKDASELKVAYSHTGRPRWCAPGNYITDKKFATIIGEAPTDPSRQVELSKCYFRRWYSESLSDGVRRSKDHVARNIAYQPTGNIKIEAISEDQFTATPFTDPSYWANVSVKHWYDTAVENGKTVRKTLTGADIKLVERFSKVNANTGKVTYSNRVYPLTADGVPESPYTWSDAVPAKVKAAMGAAADSFTYESYRKAMQKTASTPKASSRVTVDANFSGLTFDEIQKEYENALKSVSNATDMFR